MYEVEVKAHLQNRKEVIKRLKTFGCKFSKELHQVDRIFLPEGIPLPEPLGTPVFRVRKENEKVLFTLKITQSGRQDCIERELEILDGSMMVEIVKHIKFYEIPIVDKKRIKTHVGDIEIVLDTVKGLGDFIEAEKIVTAKNPEKRKKIQRELFDFLGTLGIGEKDRVYEGKYPIMLWEKRMKKKK
ncbi:class IV adenylate cyclase [Candidatus Nomurabacteria bacterium]|nr:class IV adenylate cyclase [Candidatus Nomurabacteria bacterium]